MKERKGAVLIYIHCSHQPLHSLFVISNVLQASKRTLSLQRYWTEFGQTWTVRKCRTKFQKKHSYQIQKCIHNIYLVELLFKPELVRCLKVSLWGNLLSHNSHHPKPTSYPLLLWLWRMILREQQKVISLTSALTSWKELWSLFTVISRIYSAVIAGLFILVPW